MTDRILTSPVVNISCNLRISEEELMALNELASYGNDVLVKIVSTHISPGLEKQANGFKSFFDSIRAEAPGILNSAKRSREAFGTKETK